MAEAKQSVRAGFEDLMVRRFFYVPAFEIYGGVAGLYDYGPPGCAVMTNLLSFWRQHFVLTEDMLEISSVAMTPEVVLKTSGHVDRFTDFMVKDEKTGEPFRADKLLEEELHKLLEDKKNPPSAEQRDRMQKIKDECGSYQAEQLEAAFAEYGVKSPAGNSLSKPFPFNLMFVTQIGPTGKFTGYLRPETAQGIFVNFRRLLDYNGGRMPFAAAQVGPAFRNEIAPRQGLLRVREFSLAEIEHFVNPADKSHVRFKEVADVKLRLLSRELQDGKSQPAVVAVGEAVAKGMINNETLGYFMARTHLFLRGCGLPEDRIRFRQHLSTEMAHYATDCWDAEILNTYGWIECVGHADRSAYDLEAHARVSKVDMSAYDEFDAPRQVDVVIVKLEKGKLGKLYRDKSKSLMDSLMALEKDAAKAREVAEELKKGKTVFKTCDGEFEITSDAVSISFETKTMHGVKYTPAVIEPSYGLGRILYSILENSYYVRAGDEQRAVLRLPAILAPVKCSLFPIHRDDAYIGLCHELSKQFVLANLTTRVDTSGASIGKRYARTDEIGVPFAITVDKATVTDKTVTLRERDSTVQIRVPTSEVVSVVSKLVNGQLSWEDATKAYPVVERNEDADKA